MVTKRQIKEAKDRIEHLETVIAGMNLELRDKREEPVEVWFRQKYADVCDELEHWYDKFPDLSYIGAYRRAIRTKEAIEQMDPVARHHMYQVKAKIKEMDWEIDQFIFKDEEEWTPEQRELFEKQHQLELEEEAWTDKAYN